MDGIQRIQDPDHLRESSGEGGHEREAGVPLRRHEEPHLSGGAAARQRLRRAPHALHAGACAL